MEDEITINLRALTEENREGIFKILDSSLNLVEDETNAKALEVLFNFKEF